MAIYTTASVSVTSNATPVSLIPPGDKTAYVIRVRSAAAVSILLWPYQGATPGSIPSNAVFELSAGQALMDADALGSYMTDAMQEGFAAVLETGSTAVTVDVLYRG